MKNKYSENIVFISANLEILNSNTTRHSDSWHGFLHEFKDTYDFLLDNGYTPYCHEPAPSKKALDKYYFMKDGRKVLLSYQIEESFDEYKYYNLEDIKKSIEKQYSKNLRKTKIFLL
jgi:hypothetical protein